MLTISAVERVQLFGFPLGQARIAADDPDLAALVKEIDDEERRSTGVALSNRGGWQSDKRFFEGRSAAFEPIKEKIYGAFEQFLEDVYGRRFSADAFSIETWANVNYRGHFNASHDHTAQDNHWSGILYLRTGDGELPRTGLTVFENRMLSGDGRFIATVPILEDASGPVEPMYELIPEPGKLVFFPGTLRHHVRTYEGDERRITVAFNIRVRGLTNYVYDQGSMKARTLSYMRVNFRGLVLAGARLKRMLS